MMQILGFRGSKDKETSSSSLSPLPGEESGLLSTSNATPSSPHTPVFAGGSTVGPARPLRLVYCDEKGKFCMDPEAVAALQLVKGPVGVVSVCGRARQGKSFVLNQLLGRSSGFQVASTHRPCTKGLWMWSVPIKMTAVDGTDYNLVLLDSEGIDAYDQTGTYSIQIFSLAVLLSSMFIYNQMGGIDEAALDRLSLVTEMTKHIRVRASGGRSTPSELGQFSPVFVWLLRDFYLDLAEENKKITPRDYLELALRPTQGGGRDLASKNEIRESIRSLFPDRECFTLVRPLNNENDLQRLDQIPLDNLRPEFRYGLDALTNFVFERTRPKQVGSTSMTGPLLAGITQSFLDALNNGAVPIISSSWQSVEEAECLRAFETASDVYMSTYDHTKPPEEALLMEVHEAAVQKSVDAFNMAAVGLGLARQKYEMLLHNLCKKTFEDYKTSAYLRADLQCASTIQAMEMKLRAACRVQDAKLDYVIKVLDDVFSEYLTSAHGPSKWQKLATFLQQCLDGPVLDLFNKQLSQLESEKNALKLQCRSNNDKLELLRKQVEASEKHKNQYMRRFEEAVSDKRKISDDYSILISNLQTKSISLEEKCMNLLKALDSAKNDSSSWKLKYENSALEFKAEEDRLKADISIIKCRASAVEGRLAATREQSQSAQQEALEWKQKYNITAGEVKSALERAAISQECTNKKAIEREDVIREEFSRQLVEKDEELKLMMDKLEVAENKASDLHSRLQVTESKLVDRERETSVLSERIGILDGKLDVVNITAQTSEKEVQRLKQEMENLKDKYLSELKKFEEADLRCRTAETEAKKATELADKAQKEVASALKEKTEVQTLAMQRSSQIERAVRLVEDLEREKTKMMEETMRLNLSEREAIRKVALLEERVEEREREMELLLNRNNAQRSDTVQVLESLLASERTALAEASERAETLSLQLQATQRKLDAVHQELSSVRLNESALDSRLRTASHGKRSRMDNYTGTESVLDMKANEIGKKRPKSRASPLKRMYTEDGGSIYREEDDRSQSYGIDLNDYTKFTALKLKHELRNSGFGTELLQLKNPNKKEILRLYEKHVLKK